MNRLRAPGLIAYGLLGLPLASAALPIYVHLPNLYGGVLGMNLAVLGVVLLGARLADAFVDPWLGALNDRLQQPRASIAAGLVLLVAGVFMAFHPPGPDATKQTVLWLWLSASLVPVYLGYSLASISYMAWGAQLGESPHERTRVTAYREAFGLAGVLLASVLPALMAPRIDLGLARYSVILCVATLLCAAVTLPAAPRPPRPARLACPETGILRVPLSDRRFAALLLVFMLNGIASALPATLVLFFVNDALQLAGDAGLFLGVYFAAGAMSLPFWVGLSRGIGKQTAWLAAMLAAVLAFAGASTLGSADRAGFIAVCALSGLALGADLALPPALLADAIRSAGRTAYAGAYFGVWNFVTKLNLALAAGIALPLLELAGYAPGNPGSVRPLYFAYCLLPCVLKLAAAGALWKFSRPPRTFKGAGA